MRVMLVAAAMLAAMSAGAAHAQVKGEPTAVAAAEKLLAAAGGREAWGKARTYYVEERSFLPTGEVGELKIWRDFVSGDRRLERRTPSGHYVEWLSKSGGWSAVDGKREAFTSTELAQELLGLQQEPYAFYRRLALNDPALRVELRERNTKLAIFDGDRMLCWLTIDAQGGLRGWGNFWNGSINEHWYGPVADMGDANLPKWGVQTTGNFRFEYVTAKFSPDALAEPKP